MTDSLSIDIKNEKINNALKKLYGKTTNLRPVMRAIAEKIMDFTKENFRTEGSRLGEPWQQLSPATKKWRQEKGYDGKMLQVQRKLYNSISAYADNDSAVVGTNLAYAKVHQLGFDGDVSVKAHARKVASKDTYRGKKRKTKTSSGIGYVKAHTRNMSVPARPFLGLNDGDKDAIVGLIRSYLHKF